jgi:hypothetical protein
MRVKFKVDRTTKESTPQHFKAGQVYALSDSSARHWINRGVAEEYTEPVKEPIKVRTPEPVQPVVEQVEEPEVKVEKVEYKPPIQRHHKGK